MGIETKYIIKNSSDVTPEMEANSKGNRVSLDGEWTILKYDGLCPDVFLNHFTYNHSEIMEIVNTVEWQIEPIN